MSEMDKAIAIVRWAYIENCCWAISAGAIIATAGFSGYPHLGWAVLIPAFMAQSVTGKIKTSEKP